MNENQTDNIARAWPPTPELLRVVVIQPAVELRQSASPHSPILQTLQIGDEVNQVRKIRAEFGGWIEVELASRVRGYIPESAIVRPLYLVSLLSKSAKMYASPSDSTPPLRQFKRRDLFLLLQSSEPTLPTAPKPLYKREAIPKEYWFDDTKFVRVRDMRGQEGFIDGNTLILPYVIGSSKRAERDVAIGGAVLFIGLVVTGLTYAAADARGGGKYIFAWGAIVFGGLQFLKGLLRGGGKSR